MAATAAIGVYEELMFQFDDLGDLGPSPQPNDEPLSPPSDEQNYILRHSKSDPMLTSPTSREVMRSQQMAIARRLVSLQACGQQRYLALRGRLSIDEDFAGGQGGQDGRHQQENHEDDERDGDEDGAVEDDVSNAPTIEQIKDDYNSCFSCGVSWSDNHVSLDCKECGGYALTRPCLACEGQCTSLWTRNLAASHDHRQAQWEGGCSLRRPVSQASQTPHDKRPKSLMKAETATKSSSSTAEAAAAAATAANTNNSTVIIAAATGAPSASSVAVVL